MSSIDRVSRDEALTLVVLMAIHSARLGAPILAEALEQMAEERWNHGR
ncbi:hypothetical protein [Methylobacterium planeticum]|nr:hypothetical protein [Methylobacterium planeticum]